MRAWGVMKKGHEDSPYTFQMFTFDSPENIRKPKVSKGFLIFSRGSKATLVRN